MFVRTNASLGAVCCLALASCGGGSSTPDATPEIDSGSADTVLTGVFVDSPVEGATYNTESQTGITNPSGEFRYLAGEQVTFSIGALQLPAIAAASQVSPVDMAAEGSNPVAIATNIARLLQSLDIDGMPENGITIPPNAAANAAVLNFDVSVEAFANDTDVINLVSNSGSVTTALIPEIDAISHLEGVLNTEVSTVNDSVQQGPEFNQDMLVGRTLVPFPIGEALNPHSTFRFDSAVESVVVGTPGGELRSGDFPWTLDADGVVVIDFDDFQAGVTSTLKLESTDGQILTIQTTFDGIPDPVRDYTLSTPVSTSEFSGRTINVQSADGSGTVEFRADGQFVLSNSRGDQQSGTFAQHPVDGIIINDIQSQLVSEIVLASGTLDDGFIMKLDFGDSGIFRVEFFETDGNNWTALHTVAR